ncbi:hypothetical protein WICANDRAFT_62365 [Wickerhamomyces anomalus NRRL Y-366-8]|uniref:Squalene monooxygenase n=1 Tax=Wickerhamomyces anomalus (strain ATCC 58044 / CBS 1984 / NCYC 433 / NRRL Y-366-8) TaxID=683960 RepID=A0A1E3P3E6_WICAA|nr:uncharacterized protein WICANDRAFT_62365 [Wickerhamomyces anomalus NRRL Y-366-8]ODQ59780.1 hypothetical protein WICANDRAFT_62365 [Wickerhamomyces anomalus NRRL Y-366-8]
MTTSTEYEAIVVGAGAIGPAIAVGLARQGRKVLLVERDWREPDRIVGELMQPVGLRALRSLGMVQAINNIDATPVEGYTVFYEGQKVQIPYPFKADVAPYKPLKNCVFDGNDKVLDDSTLSRKVYEEGEREMGVSFEHGKYISNLRNIAKNEGLITPLEATVTGIIQDQTGVHGVKVNLPNNEKREYRAALTVVCDGIFSKYRKTLGESHVPTVNSGFIALKLKDADVPVKYTGHVILGGSFSPVLVYQITPTDTRMLCAYNGPKPPKDIKGYLQNEVLPNLPKELHPSVKEALKDQIKTHPNSYLPARQNDIPGLLVIGDALNMRHPLTGGGMSVGLGDTILVLKLFENIKNLADREAVNEALLEFHYERKHLDTVVNVLSIALFSLFSADSANLRILQKGCFRYFQRGGDCVSIPVGFLSGLLPRPYLLTWVFFKVAFYSIACNFGDNGLVLLPWSIIQIFTILFTAAAVFTPYLWKEFFN